MKLWKISDTDCPICTQMATFDAALAAEFEWDFGVIDYDLLSEHSGICDYIRTNLVASDGTVDIPMYIVEVDGDLVGAVVGRQTKSELKRKLFMVAG